MDVQCLVNIDDINVFHSIIHILYIILHTIHIWIRCIQKIGTKCAQKQTVSKIKQHLDYRFLRSLFFLLRSFSGMCSGLPGFDYRIFDFSGAATTFSHHYNKPLHLSFFKRDDLFVSAIVSFNRIIVLISRDPIICFIKETFFLSKQLKLIIIIFLNLNCII